VDVIHASWVNIGGRFILLCVFSANDGLDLHRKELFATMGREHLGYSCRHNELLSTSSSTIRSVPAVNPLCKLSLHLLNHWIRIPIGQLCELQASVDARITYCDSLSCRQFGELHLPKTSGCIFTLRMVPRPPQW